MQGFVESIEPDQIRGWAFDPNRPDDHVVVIASVDGSPIGSAIANLSRHDLVKAGLGRGDHGFAIQFTRPMKLSSPQQLVLHALSNDGPVALPVLERNWGATLDWASSSDIPVVDTEQFPVFILGPARSGTSALALGLLKSRHYEGFGEGHLLPLAQDLLTRVHSFYEESGARESDDTFLRRVPVRAFERLIRRGFIQLTRSAFPSGYWMDKTPKVEMVHAAPLFQELWPNARFIFLKRRVIENIASRRRKFSDGTLENHYLDWANIMTAWLGVRRRLDTAALEIDQLELARDPARISRLISDFLKMPDDASGRLFDALKNDRPERTASDIGTVINMTDLNLSETEFQDLRQACDVAMAELGYAYDEYYSLS